MPSLTFRPSDCETPPARLFALGTLLAGAFLATALADAGGADQPSAPVAISGARLFPVAGPPIESGVLLMQDGRIAAVGAAGDITIPEGATVIDATGKTIIPGLVCTHSHVGDVSGGDRSAPIQPEVRVIDSIDVRDTSFEKARAGGLTLLNIMPGSGHLLSGQTLYLKLRDGNTVSELAITNDDGTTAGGIKMANGTNSIRDAPFPGTRGKSAALVRQQFLAAREYKEKLDQAGDDPEKRPERNLAMEALVDVLDGRRVVHHHTHRHDDIVTVLRLREEFGFRVVLHHVSEAWKVVDEIATAGVPCSIILLDSPGGKLEALNIAWRNGAVLEKAGVPTAIHTDDPITDSRWFLRCAALAVRAGMSREKALEALTIAGARMLDLGDRTGTLEAGKDADFVVLSGDPFSVYTRVLQTWVEGRPVFDLEDPEDRLWAEGGFGAGQARIATDLCCFSR